MKTHFDVTIRKQFPAWDEVDGITYRRIYAASKREAIKIARQRAEHAGHTGAGSGRASFTATESTDE